MQATKKTLAWMRRTAKGKTLLIVGGMCLFGLGLLLGIWIPGTAVPITSNSIRIANNQYQLIDPVLYTSIPESASYPAYTPLKDAVTAYANTATVKGNVSAVSVYYRDLNSNRWVALNPTDTFWPASMLKVVVLMSVLHSAETSPGILTQQITIPTATTTPDSEQDFYPPSDPALPGMSYSVNTLLQKMIVESDNTSNTALNSFIGESAVEKTFSDLYVPLPDPATGAGITTQQYSHLFRVLYNATYLSPVDSNRALELLSTTTFTQGIVAGVPAGTTVAHKFGETTLSPAFGAAASTPVQHELHDCGIVYYPDHPYFICVMTRGTNYTALTNFIQGMSHTVWQQVDDLNNKTKPDPESGFF